MARFNDLSGQRFGMLFVINRNIRRHKSHTFWNCICNCGTRSIVIANNLRRGLSKSCGCQVRETNRIRMTTHGETAKHKRSREFNSWRAIFDRCENPKNKSFKYYGARGIYICKRWKKFTNFLNDMGRCPPKKSIDRINNNGHYKPSNCRWATAKQQRANRRDSKKF